MATKIDPKYACLVALLFAVAPRAEAQDAKQLVDELGTGVLPIEAKEIPLLIPFAREWDRIAATEKNAAKAPSLNQYRSLSKADKTRLSETLSALAGNDEALSFFTKQETIDAFSEAYSKAQAKGSSIALIPHHQAMRYWMVSRVLAAGPEAMARYSDGYVSPEWCLPPLILCTPPTPVPDDK